MQQVVHRLLHCVAARAALVWQLVHYLLQAATQCSRQCTTYCTVLQLGLHWCGNSAALYAAMCYIVPLLRIYLAALSVLELEYVCVLIILLIYIPLLLLIYICYSCRFLLLG